MKSGKKRDNLSILAAQADKLGMSYGTFLATPEGRKMEADLYRAGNQRLDPQYEIRKCAHCGKHYEAKRTSRRLCCSDECTYKYQKAYQKNYDRKRWEDKCNS